MSDRILAALERMYRMGAGKQKTAYKLSGIDRTLSIPGTPLSDAPVDCAALAESSRSVVKCKRPAHENTAGADVAQNGELPPLLAADMIRVHAGLIQPAAMYLDALDATAAPVNRLPDPAPTAPVNGKKTVKS